MAENYFIGLLPESDFRIPRLFRDLLGDEKPPLYFVEEGKDSPALSLTQALNY